MTERLKIAELLSKVPIPQPDPRGSTFSERIPRAPAHIFSPQFYPGEIPPALWLGMQGLPTNPDKLIIHPDKMGVRTTEAI